MADAVNRKAKRKQLKQNVRLPLWVLYTCTLAFHSSMKDVPSLPRQRKRRRSLSFAYMKEESDSDDSSTVQQHHLPWISKS